MTNESNNAMPDQRGLFRSPASVGLLLVGAVIAVPVALGAAFLFQEAIAEMQQYVFTTLPADLGFDSQPVWWQIPPLLLAGLLVGLTIRFLPGEAGHKPAGGFALGAPVLPIELPGIVLASLATLSLGVVLGPEAPLIAIGSGVGVLTVRLIKRDAPERAVKMIGAVGSLAAIATLFGSFSLSTDNIPPVGSPTLSHFLWAVAIGLVAPFVGAVISRGALFFQPIVERRMLLLMPVVGLFIGVLTMVFVLATDQASANVLFSGQDQLAPLIEDTADWTVGALVLLVVFKSLAYGAALTSFRGGPVFPAMFIGAAGGMALSHLPGLPMIAGVAMGMGAMTVAMLGLPLLSLLLVVLLLQADGLRVMPVVIVAVAVAYFTRRWLAPASPPAEVAVSATASA